MKNQIVVTIGVENNKVITYAYYRYTSFVLVSCVLDFKSYEYSKYLFFRVGKKLGQDLFLESRRVDVFLPKQIHFYNGFCPDIQLWAGFDLLAVLRREVYKSIGGDELETFYLAFRYGLRKGFSTLHFDSDGSLSKFAKEFAEKQPYY